eukprot:1402983-Pyramimonas_sp.AAC.1
MPSSTSGRVALCRRDAPHAGGVLQDMVEPRRDSHARSRRGDPVLPVERGLERREAEPREHAGGQ